MTAQLCDDEKVVLSRHTLSTYICFPGCPTLQFLQYACQIEINSAPCTAWLKIIFTEPTVICTLVVGVAVMVAHMKPITYTKEITRCTLSAAKLNTCLHLSDQVIEFSA